MTAYTFDSTINAEEIGRNGGASIRFKVKGFWSSDTIRIYVDRKYGTTWYISLSNSSGGRDPKEVADDAEAYINYGQALIAAGEFAKKLQESFPEFEKFFQIRRAELAAEYEAEEVAKQAAFDADEALGEDAAKKLMNTLVTDVTYGKSSMIVAYDRGEYTKKNIQVTTNGNTTWTIRGNRVSKAEVIKHLTTSSVRSTIV